MKTGSAAIRGSFASNRTSATTLMAGRASAEAQPGTQPETTATSDAWSHFLRPSLSAASLADRREAIVVIEQALREGDTHLDFHNVSAAALKAVPGAAIKALARQATAVTLPAGLDRLPRCLNRLKGLRSIEMAECTARQIDVTRWDLDTLTVTGRTKLRWIAANEDTRVSCPAPGIRRKVCVNVFRDGVLLGHTAAGSRRYIKVPDRRAVNRNGIYTMRNGQLAVCRHITTWWFGARSARRAEKLPGKVKPDTDMYEVLRNRRAFRKAITWDMHEQYYRALEGATRNIMVGNDRFGKVVAREFRRMRRSGLPATSQFQVNSITHAMGLELNARSGRNGKPEYSLVFYDPNMSETHLRIKFHRSHDALDLTLSSLFAQSESNACYFGDHPPIVTLVDLDSVQPTKKRTLQLMLTEREKPSPMTMNLVIRDKFEEAALYLIDELRAMPNDAVDWKALLNSSVDGSPQGEYFPLLPNTLDNHLAPIATKLVELFAKLWAEGVVDGATLFELLQKPSADAVDWPSTPLSLACELNECEFIDCLIDALVKVNADGLATYAKYETLLTNGGANLPSPYARAIQCGHIGAALCMVEGMLRLTDANRITRDQFVRLLACPDNDGVPALEKAFEDGNAKLVVTLMQSLISPATERFSVRQLLAMLSVARSDGTPALRAAYGAGQAELLAAYGKLILSAVARERIRPLDAIVLLAATKRGETPCEALLAMAPRGDMLRTLDHLLHDVRVARWLPHDLSEALDALYTDDPSNSDSDSSSQR